ncbi:hypothetical protein [Nitratireductor sp. StC3]|uniref:hypothetical protein n=1 Tax=Nitratireductor sp. StC3 TaxID=2126741 RepID=UPI000D0CF00C|nr:hypothetical protein [Nitratireductor sp. StC3]PSM20210.1 hypothetical protein C7T96_03965 [Nitratireductor sp. StC3]
MTREQYWSVVKHHFTLTRTRFRAGDMVLCRNADGGDQYVRDPTDLLPAERRNELLNLARVMDVDEPCFC